VRGLLTLSVVALAGCGQHTATTSFPEVDAGDSSALPAADAPFPCGSPPVATCTATQYCVVGCTDEGPVVCVDLTDGGLCPEGYTRSAECAPGPPCAENPGPTWPTECVDDLSTVTCDGAGIDPYDPSRTVYCACTL
jgi:hypothetical protein